MRKYLLTACVFLFLAQGGWAQNTNPWPVSGNIGIGTTLPATLLHVYQPANSDNMIIADLFYPNNFAGLSIRSAGTELMGIKGNPTTGELRLGGFHSAGYYATFYSNNAESMRLTGGRLGIGMTTPASPLHVYGGETMTSGWNKTATIEATYPVQIFNSACEKWAGIGYDYSSAMRFWVNSGSNDLSGSAPAVMSILNNGNMLIGKTSQTNNNYKLDVGGKVRADEIVVNTTGADFVFAKNYKLRSLADVKAYIDVNGHLPDVPSAKAMQEEGVGVSELQTKLLQKVEELTLYIIEQDKKNRQLEERIKELETKKKRR